MVPPDYENPTRCRSRNGCRGHEVDTSEDRPFENPIEGAEGRDPDKLIPVVARPGVSGRHGSGYCVHLDEHAGAPVTERRSIAEARRNLPSLVRDAQNGRAVELTRRGEPVAVLIGHREFGRLTSGRRGFGKAYREFASAFGLALDPDELFGDVREKTAGHDVRLL